MDALFTRRAVSCVQLFAALPLFDVHVHDSHGARERLPPAQAMAELNEDRLHADSECILRRLNLSADQAADLAAFLRALSSR